MHIVGIAFVAVALAMFIGAMVQGVIGFGMVVVAFPVLISVEPALVPQTTMISAIPMIATVAWRNRGESEWGEIGWLTLGRVPGYVGAVILLATLSRDLLSILGGLCVLGAVAASLWAPALKRTTPALLVGGFISALFGTAISIGGPPIGLLYQNEKGSKLRSTISLQMLFGAPVSVLVLVLAGRVSSADISTGLALLPFTLAGSYSAKWVIPHFDDRLRPVILGVCGFAATIVIARVVLG